jgi:hypothetical protein
MVATMSAAELRLFRAVLEIAKGRLTMVSPGKQPHVAILASQEHEGICNTRFWRSGCGPRCQEIRATLTEAEALLAEAEAGKLVQMELREAS